MRIRSWLEKRRLGRAARKAIQDIFRRPEALEGTSLRPRHAARWVLLDYDVKEGKVARVRFGILRHPKPYAFSRQSHKVIEVYEVDLEASRVQRVQGRNVTRLEGRDADDL